MSPRPVLVVQHEDACPPGHLAAWAREAAVTLDVRRCHDGEDLPATLSEHSGMVLLGGEMSAYDDARFPWLTAAKSLVIQAVISTVPFLGVCLGHQLAAVALGGRVAAHPHGPIRGVQRVGLLPSARQDPLARLLPADSMLLHWNSDVVVGLPGGASVLALDGTGHVQMVRFGEQAWGVQGHPEAGPDIVTVWGRTGSSHECGPATAGHPPLLDTDGVLAQIADAGPLLVSAWSGPAGAFFAATRAPGAGRAGRSVLPLVPPPTEESGGHTHVHRR